MKILGKLLILVTT